MFVTLLFTTSALSSHRIRITSEIVVILIVIIITREFSVTSDQHLPNYLSGRRRVNPEIRQHLVHGISTHQLHYFSSSWRKLTVIKIQRCLRINEPLRVLVRCDVLALCYTLLLKVCSCVLHSWKSLGTYKQFMSDNNVPVSLLSNQYQRAHFWMRVFLSLFSTTCCSLALSILMLLQPSRRI